MLGKTTSLDELSAVGKTRAFVVGSVQQIARFGVLPVFLGEND